MTSCNFMSPDSMRVISATHPQQIPTQKSLQTTCQCKQELDTRRTHPQTPSELTSLFSPRSDEPALEFPCSPIPMEIGASFGHQRILSAVAFRTTPTTKRKSEVTSDISEADLAAPAKKKPGPKLKVQTVKPSSEVNSSKPECDTKYAKKKPGPKPKPRSKPAPKIRKSKKTNPTSQKDEEEIEIETPATVLHTGNHIQKQMEQPQV
ncbi:hypothetical protein K438DRAFT_1778835 [Mycena galopus ATCC 62051]|nr:hypothetical protein K438DRAFT_1778835 [Mycena galopus ATCC 62051]